jgi:hypothetical protein
VGGLRQLALVHAELGIEQQLRHSEHPVHRRSDLVAHVGQELRLGPTRLLGPLGRRAGLFGLLLQLERTLVNLLLEAPLMGRHRLSILAKAEHHASEVSRQIADLVAGADDLDLSIEVAVRDVARTARERPDR